MSSPYSVTGLAEWDKDTDLEGITCPVTRSHMRPGKRTPDLGVILTSTDLTDLIWTWHSECLIQDHVLRLFREEGLTGFEVRPVRVGVKRRAPVPEPDDVNPGLTPAEAAWIHLPVLWEVVVTGWAGVAPPESGVKLSQNRSCPVCGYLVYRGADDPSLLIDESQWDGSDFFIVWPYPGFVFVTDRAAEVIRKHKLTGVRLIPPEDLDLSGGTITPGRLSYWMPEERAKKLGVPLGIY